MSFTALLGAIALVAILFVSSRKYHLPPGPTGNVAGEFTNAPMYEIFDKWRRKYGRIFSFKLGTRRVVVLNNIKATTDLLDKKGDIYSSRPRLVVAHDILSGGKRGLSSPYGDHWRRWRKLQHMGMNGKIALSYREQQTLESTLLLHELLTDSSEHQKVLQRFVTSIVLGIAYGRRIDSLNDEMVTYNYNAVLEYQRASTPGKYIVETWPSLLWLPRPLQWFRPALAALEKIREKDTEVYMNFLNGAKERYEAGIAKDSMATYSLSKGGNQGMTDVEVAYALSAPFSAGVDTTLSTIGWSLVAALSFPDTATRIQSELDSVVGKDRLPTFEDERSLPYLTAFIKEWQLRAPKTKRWRPVVPLAIPHATSKDDVYDGYDIPKGTTVYGSVDALVKDPELFEDPETFNPSRFLSPHKPAGNWNGKVEGEFTMPFGFGRRVCPGMHVALQSTFISIARILWAFDLSPPEGGSLPDYRKAQSLGKTRLPPPYQICVRPRHAEVERIIAAESAEAKIRLKEWEY
ncbi:cytochrome P450 [Multifurca ochricompacta]|uniref:Cytochrome P450 n=1 Tax=Multifurca ochricompacta TaxID=376703 RepID=A0AAD4M3M2_9AGAM|nr:cytochrome P450 [Multifurca ochricompacta]